MQRHSDFVYSRLKEGARYILYGSNCKDKMSLKRRNQCQTSLHPQGSEDNIQDSGKHPEAEEDYKMIEILIYCRFN